MHIGAAQGPRRRVTFGGFPWVAVLLAVLAVPASGGGATALDSGGTAGATVAVYTVTGILLDVRARTAARARDLAITQGQRQALIRLLARLTLPEDRVRVTMPNDAAISGLIGGIELADEKSSATRYLATLTVRFRAPAVRHWLRHQNVPFSETRLRPVLVLPVFAAAGLRLLWETPNPWRTAWADYNTRNDLVPFIVPKGDLGDVALVSALDVIQARRPAIDAVARRYQAGNILLAVARLDYVAPGRRPRLNVALRQFGAWGTDTRELNLEAAAGTTTAAAIADAVRTIATDYENAWKRRTIIHFDERQSLQVSARLAGFQDWLDLKRRLRASALVPRIEILSLTSTRAELRIDFLGNFDQLAVSLAQSDVEIEARDGGYVIRERRPNGSDPQRQ